MSRKYDSTVARIAGNIAAGMVGNVRYLDAMKQASQPGTNHCETLAANAVELARAIVAETERTEPHAASQEKPA